MSEFLCVAEMGTFWPFFFLNRDQKKWPLLADGLNIEIACNRGNKMTKFKKEKERGFFVWPNWQMAVIEVDVIEGFYL